jgi:hypothetical protein
MAGQRRDIQCCIIFVISATAFFGLDRQALGDVSYAVADMNLNEFRDARVRPRSAKCHLVYLDYFV